MPLSDGLDTRPDRRLNDVVPTTQDRTSNARAVNTGCRWQDAAVKPTARPASVHDSTHWTTDSSVSGRHSVDKSRQRSLFSLASVVTSSRRPQFAVSSDYRSRQVVSAPDCGTRRGLGFESHCGRFRLSRQPLQYTASGTDCVPLQQCSGQPGFLPINLWGR